MVPSFIRENDEFVMLELQPFSFTNHILLLWVPYTIRRVLCFHLLL